MDLKQLQAIGAIVPRTLFKRKIEFQYPELKPEAEWVEPGIPEPTGETLSGSMEVFIRRGSSADAIEIANASDRERPFVAIFRSVCTEDGAPVFPTIEDAMQLATWIVVPLFNAINSVSGGGAKNSQPRTSSGTNSPSSSGARSKKFKRRSVPKSATPGASTAPSAAP
jgi:hypothetical protein